MKKHLLLVLFLMSIASLVIGQTKTTVYGDLGVENVNVSLLGTQYGTSTDSKGRYELPIYDRSSVVNLYYSCIGYQDTIVSLTTKQLEQDSINISFRMKIQDYSLQEVGVTASRDFYRTKRNRNIADMVFLNDNIYLLENKIKSSSLVVLDLEGVEKSREDYGKFYEELFIDCFGNVILVGQDSCMQIYLDGQENIRPVSSFSRELFREKLLQIVCEFNDAYIIRNAVHDKGTYWLKYNHGRSQDFSYVLKNDSKKEQCPLCSFLDTLGFNDCQTRWVKIQTDYHLAVAGEDGIDLINEGIWDGNMISLAATPSLMGMIQWYCNIAAKKEYQITPLVFEDMLQFVDLENRQIVEIDKEFQVASRRPLKVLSGEEYFNNVFLKDDAAGSAYGLFVQNGVNYLGLYDPVEGTVSMGQKATKVAYPRLFRVYNGYAYTVVFDSYRSQSVVNRIKINN